jgi:hypothetical protein
MNASLESSAQPRWLLLIHGVPPRPDYLRVRVRRRLQRIGAIPLKATVYVLPRSERAMEDFQWLRQEIVSAGGSATVCAAELIEGASDAQLEEQWRAARDADYASITGAARTAATLADVARLRRQLGEVVARDFFGAQGRLSAERVLAELAERFTTGGTMHVARETGADSLPRGSTWVTRQGVHVDRIASAWLIRRFIDADARFRFVPPDSTERAPAEVRFDMFEGEYTHEGDRCTFETLLARFALDDPALGAVAEVVHDIDCKDGKYGRAEVAGIDRIVRGIALAHAEDAARIDAGTPVFEALYASFRAGGA